MALSRSAAPQTLKTQTKATAHGARLASDSVAAIADRAAMKSPYAAGAAKASGSEVETTPGTRKLSPIVRRNMCGPTIGINASIRFIIRSRGQIQRLAATTDATKLVRALNPSRACVFIEPPLPTSG